LNVAGLIRPEFENPEGKFMRFLVPFLTALLVLTASPLSAETTITYQGQLQDASGPYTGTPGMIFRLYDSLTGDNQIGGEESFSGVPVEDGLFQVELDFGEGAFDGGARWLEIEVAGDILDPRQKITGSPWSHQALSVTAGSVGSDQIAPGAVGSDELQSDSVSIGSGTGLEGGGEIPLGGSTTIGIAPGGVGADELANEAISGNKLDSGIDISTSGTISANDLNADGELRVNANADANLSYIRFRDGTGSDGPRIFHREADNQLMFRGVSNIDAGGSLSTNTVDAQNYLQGGQPFEPGAPIIQTQMPAPADPGTVWMRLDEAGSEIWQHSVHSGSVRSVFERNGVVYSGSADNTVIAADASDGNLLWQHSHHTGWVRSVFERNGVVYSGSWDRSVVAADANKDGAKLWSHGYHFEWVNSVFERNDVVYSGADDGKVIAADANDGQKLWEHNHHGNGFVESVFERNGVVYSGGGGRVVAADANDDGAELWNHTHHPGSVLSVFERNGVVYSGSSDNTVIAADASNGAKLWQHNHHDHNVQSVFERNGVVYSGSDDNTVIAADARSGSLLWRHSLHSDTVRSVFERNGVVYSGSNDGIVIAATVAPATYISDGNEWWHQGWISRAGGD
jgi:outer membrane protein assembly factor BamB